MVLSYAVFFERQAGVPPYDWLAVPRATLEVIGTPLLPLLGAVPAGAVMAALLVWVLRILAFREPRWQPETLAIVACTLAVGSVAAGTGYGRGMYGSAATMESRFASLTLPLLAIAIVVASEERTIWVRRSLLFSTLALLALSWPPAAERALTVARQQHAQWLAFERDVAGGASLEQLVGRHGQTIYDDDVRKVPAKLQAMSRLRMGPFRSRGTRLRHTQLGPPHPLEVDRQGGVIRLAAPHTVNAVRVRFRLYALPRQDNWVSLHWRDTAGALRTAGIWTQGDGRLQEQLFWVWETVQEFTLDVYGYGRPRLEIERIECFDQ